MADKLQETIPQQAVNNELVNKSEMCIGWNSTMMTLPYASNVVTGTISVIWLHGGAQNIIFMQP